MIRSIIVDDELKSRESLKILIEDFCQDVAVEAICQNVEEGVSAIDQLKPDVVFLDIQLQRETGFDLLTRYKESDFEVIFTTAYSEYAIKAFKFSAIDYLLKPIDITELKRALGKVEKRRSKSITDQLQQLLQNIRSGSSENYKLALPIRNGYAFMQTRLRKEIKLWESGELVTTSHFIKRRKNLCGGMNSSIDLFLSKLPMRS